MYSICMPVKRGVFVLIMLACTAGFLTTSVWAQNPHAAPGHLSQHDISAMLPATNMGYGRASHPTKNAFSASDAMPFAAASVPKNPQAPDAVAIGSETCTSCHALEATQAKHATHLRAFEAGNAISDATASCEACHGPGSAHAGNPTDGKSIIAFTRDAQTPIETQTSTCLGCHAGGARQHWIGSIHAANDVSCSDCHNPMAKLSPEGNLANSSISETCANCHQDVRAKFNRRSHMPLPEGQISCVDCHNPHGTINDDLLKTDTVNETCYTCHAEKRGPFIFDHAPVRESCLNCHDPHGSNQQTLLTLPLPMLCQQCHSNTQHPNDLQTPGGLMTGGAPDERVIGRACLTCHTNIHGSNNPSGVRFHK